ncbi:translocation/assembly module TamB domain-containing protein [bacterium]|nr:translocation/assembly module TamB domain-containing protein [bacterium]
MSIVKAIAKWVLIAIGGLVGFVVVVLLALNFLLQSSTFTSFVLGLALPPIEESLGADIGVESLELSLFPVTLDLKGAYITPAKGEFKRRFAEVDSLELETAFWPLLRGQVVVEHVTLHGASNYLFINEKGLANLPFPPGEEKPDEPDTGPPDLKLPIEIEKIEIRGVQFYLDVDADPAIEGPETEVAVRSIELDAHGSLSTGDTHALLRISDGAFRAGELRDTLTSLQADADFSLATWSGAITRLSLRIPDVEIDATAKARDVLTEMVAEADVNGRIDIDKVNKLFMPEPDLAGTLVLTAHAEAPLPDWKVDGKIGMEGGRVNAMDLREFRILFDANQDRAKLTELYLMLADGVVAADAELGLKDEMPLEARVEIDDLNVKRVLADYGLEGLGVASHLTGDINASGRLGGEFMKIGADANLRMYDTRYTDIVAIPRASLMADIDYSPAALDVHRFDFRSRDTVIDAKGKLGLESQALDFKFLVDAKDLSEFSPIMEQKLAGKLRVQGAAKGTTGNPNVQAEIRGYDLAFGAYRLDEISGDASMAGKKARVSNLVVRQDDATLKLSAEALLSGTTPKITADVEIPRSPIEDFLEIAGMAEMEAEGFVAMTAHVEGPADRLTGKAKLDVEDATAFGENVKSVELDVALDGGVVDIRNLIVTKLVPPRPDYGVRADKIRKDVPKDQWVEAKVQAKGTFDPATGKLDLRLAAANLNEQASDILRTQGIPLVADIKLDVDAEGTIKDPRATAVLSIRNARFDRMILGNSDLKVEVADKKAHVTGELLAQRDVVEIAVPPTVRADDWLIRRINSELEPEPMSVAPDELSELTGEETPEDFTAAPPPAPEKPKAPSDVGVIRVDVTVGIDAPNTVEGEVVFDKFDFSSFLEPLKSDKDELGKRVPKKASVAPATDAPPADSDEEIVAGRLNGAVTLSGNLADPNALAASVDLDEIYFRKNALVIRNQSESGQAQPVQIEYAGGNLNVRSFRLAGKGVDLTVTEEAGGFRLELVAALSVGQEFTEILTDAKGRVRVVARIPSDLAVDRATAEVTIEDGSVAVQGVPTPVENIDVLITYGDGAAEIERLRAAIGGGRLEGGGRIRLAKGEDDVTDVQVFVRLKNVRTGMDPYLEAVIEKVDLLVTTIRTGANKGKFEISGEVVVDKAVYTKNIDFIELFNQLAEVGREKEVKGTETYEAREESLFFNIALRADGDVMLMSNLAEIETKFDLVLVGNDVTPGLRGSVDVVEGWATVLQNTYDVSYATIQFYDEQRIFPSFDINAQTEVRGSKIYVSIAGTPLNYNISFASDPPRTERDIFFMLATGASYDEFMAGGSGGGDEAAAAAAQSLVGSQLSKLAGGATGFDVGVDSAGGTARVKVTGEVEKDLYLTMYRGLVDQTLGSELEYDFLRYVALVGSWSNMAGYEDVESSGAFGTGVRFKIDFQ